jgi:hypothetical protein
MWKPLLKNTPPMAHVFNRIFTYIGWQAKRKVSFILAQGCDLWEGQDRIKVSDGAGKKPAVKVVT